MTMGWKYAKPIKEKLMKLEEPGKALPFDADRRLVDEVTAQCDIKALGLAKESIGWGDLTALNGPRASAPIEWGSMSSSRSGMTEAPRTANSS